MRPVGKQPSQRSRRWLERMVRRLTVETNIYEITFAFPEEKSFSCGTTRIDTVCVVTESFAEALACCASKYPGRKIKNIAPSILMFCTRIYVLLTAHKGEALT